MNRCNWPTLDTSPLYQAYHDHEWGIANYEDDALFELLLLESFHCGLSWLLMLKKREGFREAFDGFDPNQIALYDASKLAELMENPAIVRNKRKIQSAVKNAKAFLAVQQEFGSFSNYIWHFTDHQVLYPTSDEVVCSSALSDTVSKDLKKRGFGYMGSVTTFSFLEAIGVMNNHCSTCFCHKKQEETT